MQSAWGGAHGLANLAKQHRVRGRLLQPEAAGGGQRGAQRRQQRLRQRREVRLKPRLHRVFWPLSVLIGLNRVLFVPPQTTSQGSFWKKVGKVLSGSECTTLSKFYPKCSSAYTA